MGFEEAAVVEPVDPFEGGVLEVVEAAPGAAVADELGLVEPDDRLGEGVVVRVALRADRVDRAGLGEAFGVANREILHAPVGVVDQLVEAVAASERAQIACSNASSARSERSDLEACQPTIIRE